MLFKSRQEAFEYFEHASFYPDREKESLQQQFEEWVENDDVHWTILG